jgi:hypothetical protein
MHVRHVLVQEEPSHATAAMLKQNGLYRCGACCAIKRMDANLDSRTLGNPNPCCETCWPVVSWCRGRGIETQKICDALRNGTIRNLLTPQIASLAQTCSSLLKQHKQQTPERQEPHIQHAKQEAASKQCALCQRVSALKDFQPSTSDCQQASSAILAQTDMQRILEPYCDACRFDRLCPHQMLAVRIANSPPFSTRSNTSQCELCNPTHACKPSCE